MAKLKIKNMGPIKNGYLSDDGFMDFPGVTLLMGDQGSGKSTVAKVFSTLSWIEKALMRGDFDVSYFSQCNYFQKHLAYLNIGDYLKDRTLFESSTMIEYLGEAYKITYSEKKLTIKKVNGNYQFPKIMYVPAERNFVSTVERPDLIKQLPLPLYTFLDEYEKAKQNLRGEIYLPIGNIKFEYKKQDKKSFLKGKGFKIDLLKASSGFQSFVPLYLVTQYLTKIVKQDDSFTHKRISIDQEKKIRKEIDKIFDADISEDVRLYTLKKLSEKFGYSCFLNIVEEPEQNLYPTSQKNILFELLKSKNNHENNKLVMTTHSPYILNYLTLAIKGHFVHQKIQKGGNEKQKKELEKNFSEIIPLESTIDSADVSVYQINDAGTIKKLPDYRGLPSDENVLNQFLEEFNEDFIKLIEIEDQCRQ